MNVLITNTTLLNTGDAAIVEATRLILRQTFGAGTAFVCYDSQARASAHYYAGVPIRSALFDQVSDWASPGLRRKLALLLVILCAVLVRFGADPEWLPLPAGVRRALAEYRAADLVVSAGGTYLVPNYRLMPKIFDFLVTLAIGRPLVLFTQSLGPFPAGRERRLLGYALRRARLIMVRDARSRQHLAALRVSPSRIVIAADAAFALAPAQIDISPRRRNNPPRIAVSLRDWPFFGSTSVEDGMARYLNAVAGFVRWVIENYNAQITFVSSCQGAPEYWTDDSRAAIAVLDRLPRDLHAHVSVDRAFRTPDELIRRLKDFDCVVATRMHVAILSLCAGVTVLPIAYEFKTRELAGAMGLDGVLQDIETVSSDGLVRAWRHLREQGDAIEPGLWGEVAHARRSALTSGQAVRRALRAA